MTDEGLEFPLADRFGVDAACRTNAPDDALKALIELVTHRLGKAAYGVGELHSVGNDIDRIAPATAPQGEGRGVPGVNLERSDGRGVNPDGATGGADAAHFALPGAPSARRLVA